MKLYQTNEIRNIAIIGAAKSGKTTLSEALLFNAGAINRRGSIEEKNTVSDFKDIEISRQGSVYSSILAVEYENKKINFIDTPGIDDFVGEVISALKVTDSAIMVVNGQNAVEVGTEINWRNTKKYNTPLIFAVNQIEHEKTNYEDVVQSIKKNITQKVVLFHYPVNPGRGFNSIIDILTMKMYKFTPLDTGKFEITDIPADFKAKAEELQSALIESAAENDEVLMEKFFADGTLQQDDILKGIKIGIKQRNIFPLVCISAKQNIGIKNLLDLIIKITPAPDEAQQPKTDDGKEIKIDPSAAGPPSVFVFKTSVEQHLGEISYFKVITGKIEEGLDLVNNVNQSKERFSHLFVAVGKNRTKINQLSVGDIGATIKLKDVKTNHTLTDKSINYVIEKIQFPEPKHRVAVKAVNQQEDEKLAAALNQIAKEDPTLIVGYSTELKQIIMQGQGELHFAIVKWYLDNVYKIQANYLSPRIPYRETITKSARATYRHKKQSGGAGQFGEVSLMIEPWAEDKPYNTTDFSIRGKELLDMQWGGKLEYVNCIVGGVIDARFMPAILKGLMDRMEEGPLTGSYARDIRVYVYDGKMHPVDSNDISFRLAGRNAFSIAFKTAGPKILEPIYDVEVIVPEEKMGDVITDLQGRRGLILGMDAEGNYKKVRARVPLAQMDKYQTTLSSLTSGRATYSMKFADYQLTPPDIQENLIKMYEKEKKEEE